MLDLLLAMELKRKQKKNALIDELRYRKDYRNWRPDVEQMNLLDYLGIQTDFDNEMINELFKDAETRKNFKLSRYVNTLIKKAFFTTREYVTKQNIERSNPFTNAKIANYNQQTYVGDGIPHNINEPSPLSSFMFWGNCYDDYDDEEYYDDDDYYME